MQIHILPKLDVYKITLHGLTEVNRVRPMTQDVYCELIFFKDNDNDGIKRYGNGERRDFGWQKRQKVSENRQKVRWIQVGSWTCFLNP